MEQFTTENIKKALIKKIEQAFGTNHKIKVAIYKPVSRYNDETYDYNPLLILIDKNFNEISHEIDELYKLAPSDEEQREEDYQHPEIEDITIKF